MFDGFSTLDIPVAGTTIHGVRGGVGPPLLLLHGYPQTHAIWNRVAPALAESFDVVATDLRGYGDSGKPPSDESHAAYSKRAMAVDQVEVMISLGFEQFFVCGHDRGGRVAHRLALDHRQRVRKLAVLDIVPTLKIFSTVDQAVATGYYHWFFLIQGNGLPETLIGRDPEYFLREKLNQWGGGVGYFEPEALREYIRCFSDPATIHASCEDYRAAASIDLAHDEADLDQPLNCPVLALWGERGLMERHYDVLGTWRERAFDVRGRAMPTGHFVAEEAPDETAAELRDFFLD